MMTDVPHVSWEEAREELRQKDPHTHYLLYTLGISPEVVWGFFEFIFTGQMKGRRIRGQIHPSEHYREGGMT